MKILDGSFRIFLTFRRHYKDVLNFRTTQYTPYQPEIAQGRLESLLNYQTLVSEMTGLDVANASLLDEGTAAAEAMSLCYRHNKRKKIFVSQNIHPQTLSVVDTRLSALEVEVIVGNIDSVDFADHEYSGILIQYPDTFGDVKDFEKIAADAKKNGVSFCQFSIKIKLKFLHFRLLWLLQQIY